MRLCKSYRPFEYTPPFTRESEKPPPFLYSLIISVHYYLSIVVIKPKRSGNRFEVNPTFNFKFTFSCAELCLANRAEEFHLLLNSSLDSLCTGSEELSGVKALALKVLACLDVLSCCCCKCKLALCIYVNL